MYYVYSQNSNGVKHYFRDFNGDKIEFTLNSAKSQVELAGKLQPDTLYGYEIIK